MSIKKVNIKVYDMTCTSCEQRVERAVKKISGVVNVMASYSAQSVTVEFDEEICTKEEIKEAINSAGYSTKKSNNLKFAGFFIVVAAILLLGNSTYGFDMSAQLNNASYFVLFIVGMLTSIHCVGMCGGIMLTQSVSKNNNINIDFNEFDDVNGKFIIINAENNSEITSFTGKKGIVNVEFNLDKNGTYLIVRDNVAILGIEAADSLKNIDLEEVRKIYLG